MYSVVWFEQLENVIRVDSEKFDVWFDAYAFAKDRHTATDDTVIIGHRYTNPSDGADEMAILHLFGNPIGLNLAMPNCFVDVTTLPTSEAGNGATVE